MRFLRLISFFIYFVLVVPIVANSTIFEVHNLSIQTKNQMKKLNTWKADCPVPLERLRLIKFSYFDFNGKEQNNGQIIALDAVSSRIIAIFKELYYLKFPIAKANLIEYYNGNDEESMSDNNTSCFNCREITGGGLPSLHAYGAAIDVNPMQNPYIEFEKSDGFIKVLPYMGREYINRTNIRAGMAENIVNIFKKNGFTVWGGKWNTPIDWQHFQLPRGLAQLLAVMSPKDAAKFFEMVTVNKATLFEIVKANDNKFVELYKRNPKRFMRIFIEKPQLFNESLDIVMRFMLYGV
jgi:hypothetical protein